MFSDSVTFLSSPVSLTFLSFSSDYIFKFLYAERHHLWLPSLLFLNILFVFFHLLPWLQSPPCLLTFSPPSYFWIWISTCLTDFSILGLCQSHGHCLCLVRTNPFPIFPVLVNKPPIWTSWGHSCFHPLLSMHK